MQKGTFSYIIGDRNRKVGEGMPLIDVPELGQKILAVSNAKLMDALKQAGISQTLGQILNLPQGHFRLAKDVLDTNGAWRKA